MTRVRSWGVGGFVASVMLGAAAIPGPAAAANLVQNGSFEGQTGVVPTGWMLGGAFYDKYGPVAIAYGNTLSYPYGAQGEAVPVDNAKSLSPDPAGSNGVYFVSDEAKNLSLFQYVHLAPGSYDIGFDSYDTYNGSHQPNDAIFAAQIAGVDLAHFNLSEQTTGVWTSYSGEAKITTAGDYLVSFVFNTPGTPANPDPTNPDGIYNAKDVVIDRAFVISALGDGGTAIPSPVPLPGSLPLLGGAVAVLGCLGYGAKRWKPTRTP